MVAFLVAECAVKRFAAAPVSGGGGIALKFVPIGKGGGGIECVALLKSILALLEGGGGGGKGAPLLFFFSSNIFIFCISICVVYVSRVPLGLRINFR